MFVPKLLRDSDKQQLRTASTTIAAAAITEKQENYF